jgi:hypothetical protein
MTRFRYNGDSVNVADPEKRIMIAVVVLIVIMALAMPFMLGTQRGGRTIGPPIWRWSQWRAHWMPGKAPLADPLYLALPANQWLTCDEIFARVPLAVIGKREEVRPRMERLVARRLAERRLPEKRKFLWIEYTPFRKILYRKVEFIAGETDVKRV